MIPSLKKLLPDRLKRHLKRSLFSYQDMASRLGNLKRAGFQPLRAIDVGAYIGDWTSELWRVYPNCPCILIEPLPSKAGLLQARALQVPGSVVVSKAAGRQGGKVHFRLQETNSRIEQSADAYGTIEVACATLDEILDTAEGPTPNLAKLDVQGFELEVLAGCERHLSDLEVLILEVSVLRIGNVPLFSEVDRFMMERGYRLYDVLPQYYRPRDGALWQMDTFYVSEGSSLIASRSWD